MKYLRQNHIKMIVTIKLWLLLSLSSVAADYTYYIPQLTSSAIQGRVTASTFTLDKPQCVFGSNENNTVWLVVADKTATLSSNKLVNPASYQSFSANKYYHTLKNPETFYGCGNTAQYIRVGSESSCDITDTYCNHYLSTGDYMVKFVVIRDQVLIDQTAWSGFITLRQGKDPATIDTWPGRRSGGMIVITTILSVLVAAVFASLIGTFIIGSKKCSCFTQKKVTTHEAPPQVIDLKNYKTHHVSSSSDLYAQPDN